MISSRKFHLELAGKSRYLVLNYLAYGTNFISGLILARKLGPESRGILAYLSNLFLITLFFAPLNARNASSLSHSEVKSEVKNEPGKFSIIKLYIVSLAITSVLSLIFYFHLISRFDQKVVLFFCLSNTFNSLAILIQIQEGILRVENSLNKLAILRFLGYASPSLVTCILFLTDSLRIEFVVMGQSIAMISCFLFLFRNGYSNTSYSLAKFRTKGVKTLYSYSLDYIAIFLPLLFVGLTEKVLYLGYFAIAYGYALISDTYYQIVESKLYQNLTNDKSISSLKISFRKSIVQLFLSQLIFIPGAFLIPMLYGKSYTPSTWIAITLIVSKFMYSIVKLTNILFNLVFLRYKLATFLNLVYVSVALGFFLLEFYFYKVEHLWIFPIVFSSVITALLALFLANREMGSRYQRAEDDECR